MSPAAIPLSKAASTMREAWAMRSSALSGIPDSPPAVTMTWASCSTARSRASMRSREAELSMGRPFDGSHACRPTEIVSALEESTETGRSVRPCTVVTSQAMASFCSSSFSEISSTLRSRKSAPACSWRWTILLR